MFNTENSNVSFASLCAEYGSQPYNGPKDDYNGLPYNWDGTVNWDKVNADTSNYRNRCVNRYNYAPEYYNI